MLRHSLLPLYSRFSPQGLEGTEDPRLHSGTAPLFGRLDERGEEEREARPFPGKSGDARRPAAKLLERALQEIRGVDVPLVLHREQEVGHTA